MSTLPDSSEITPGQCSFWSLNITVNSILPAGNESFLLCVWNHPAPIFSLFEVQTVCGLGTHLTLRLSLNLKTLLVNSWELQGQELHREKKKRAWREKSDLTYHTEIKQLHQSSALRKGRECSNSVIWVSSSKDWRGWKPAESKRKHARRHLDLPELWFSLEVLQPFPAGTLS